jgi:hypothetical protein
MFAISEALQTSWNRHWMQFVPPHKTSKRKKFSIVKTYGRLTKK